MNIADIIAAITGGTNPNQAIMDAQGAMPPTGGPPQGPPPTAAPGPAPQPQTLQSPPDLQAMYMRMMEKSQDAQRLDRGMTLVAAGLSNSPANRAALISNAGHGGSGGMSLSANDMINFQKQQDAAQQQLVMQRALPSLMRQYKMTPAQITALQASGQLGDVLKHYSTENLGHVEDKETGKTFLFNQRTGQKVAEVGGEAPDPTQLVNTPAGQKPINMRTGETIGAGAGLPPTNPAQQFAEFNATRVAEGKPPMTADEFLKILHPGQSTTVNVGKENFPHVKPETGQDYVRNPDGTIKYDAEGKPTLYDIKGGEPAKKAAITATELADKEKKERIAKSRSSFAAGNVGNAVQKAFDVADKPGATGFLSRPARAIGLGGTPADDIDSALKTIDANTAFEQLKSMRDASASGASGLGQVTDTEQGMLKAVIADLRPFQSTGRFKEGLARVEAAMTLLAADSFAEGKDKARFDKEMSEMTQEILAREHNKKSGGSKVRVVPRE